MQFYTFPFDSVVCKYIYAWMKLIDWLIGILTEIHKRRRGAELGFLAILLHFY